MLIPCYTKRFKKDLQRIIKSGKNVQKLKTVIKLLVTQERLPAKYKEHKFMGEFKERLVNCPPVSRQFFNTI